MKIQIYASLHVQGKKEVIETWNFVALFRIWRWQESQWPVLHIVMLNLS